MTQITKRAGAGTIRYMAPEQLSLEDHILNTRIDVWALGCVLLQIITGKLPYEGCNGGEWGPY